MRIDSNGSVLRPSRISDNLNRGSEKPSAIRDVSSPVLGPDEIRRDNGPRFSSMTREALFEWMNEKIRSGELSVSDSAGLLVLTGKGTIRVDADQTNTEEHVNFFRVAEEGIATAKIRRDADTGALLHSALRVMHWFEGPRLDRMA